MTQPVQSPDGRVQQLVEEIRARGDFPAAAQVIQRLQASVRREHCTSLEVARTILQDPGLSSKVLRIVNSAFYNPRGNPVSTISRAVFLLGFETIRDLASGILLMEQFARAGGSTRKIRDELRRSLLCGLVAQKVSAQVGYASPEEAYLLGLFANWGVLAVAAYFPEQLDAARRLEGDARGSLARAIREVMGVAPDELAAGILESWQFPATYGDYFRQEHPRDRASVVGGAAKLAAVVDLSADWVARTADEGPAAGAEVAQRFAALFGLPAERFATATAAAMKAFTEQAPVLGLGATFPQRAPATTATAPVETAHAADVTASEPARGDQGSRAAHAALELVTEITQATVDGTDITTVLSMVLEGIARCGTFDVVLLALLTTQKDRVVGRLAYGDGAQSCLPAIAAPLERGSGVIAECILGRAPGVYPAGTAALLVPPGTPAPRLPITSLLTMPLVVRDKAVGAVVAARTGGVALGASDLRIVQLFCNQAGLALSQYAGG